MFQFPRLPAPGLCVHPGADGTLIPSGSPIRRPADRRACAPPRGLSQLDASFVGFLCQGIRRLPLKSSSLRRASLEETQACRYGTYFSSVGPVRRTLRRCDLFLRKNDSRFRAMRLSGYARGGPRGPGAATRGLLRWIQVNDLDGVSSGPSRKKCLSSLEEGISLERR